MKTKNHRGSKDNEFGRKGESRRKKRQTLAGGNKSSRISRRESIIDDVFPIGADDTMPSYSIWVVHVITIITRLAIVSDRSSWWILHPDEVFQTIEVAHSEVYGYGFRPYEYLPPPSPNTTHTPTLQEAALGMYSLRSFLLPRTYMLILYLKELFHIQANPFFVAKLFHALVSAHLPISIYFFLGQLVPNRDIRLLAPSLVSLSEHLVTFGTHTLVNSFLSPLVFGAMGWFISLEKTRSSSTSDNNQKASIPSVPTSRHITMNQDDRNLSTRMDHRQQEQRKERDKRFYDDYMSSGTVASGGSEPQTQVWINFLHEDNTVKTILQRLSCGFLFGVLLYIRIDLLMLVSFTLFLFYICDFTITKSILSLLTYATGFLGGVVLGGWDDCVSYGSWFLSPMQWYKFNIHHDLATAMFGWENAAYYIAEMCFSSSYSFSQTVIVFFSVIIVIACFYRTKRFAFLHRKLFLFFLLLIILMCVYSLKGHKEMRFIHNVFVIFLVTFSCSFCIICDYFLNSSYFCIVKSKHVLYFIILSCSLQRLYQTHSPGFRDYADKWSYRGDWASGDVNTCLEFIGKQSDATGVFLDRTIHQTGGYAILHKDIPIFAQVHFEYHEFGMNARRKIPANSGLMVHNGQTVDVAVLSKISNYVTVENSPLVLKYLFDDTVYNFVVTSRNSSIFSPIFSPVFQSGNVQVLLRGNDSKATTYSEKTSQRIPIGTNATVLEYEGSWLYTYGLYNKAIERLEEALKLDKNRIKVYQLLSLSYRALGMANISSQVFSQCTMLHGNNCHQPQPKVILHKDLDIDVKLV